MTSGAGSRPGVGTSTGITQRTVCLRAGGADGAVGTGSPKSHQGSTMPQTTGSHALMSKSRSGSVSMPRPSDA